MRSRIKAGLIAALVAAGMAQCAEASVEGKAEQSARITQDAVNAAQPDQGFDLGDAPGSKPAEEKMPRYDDLYFENAKDISLSPSEQVALDNYNHWRTSGARSLQKSYTAADGTTVFTFGAQIPSIVCALLNITDITLERGELINSVNIGDSARWSVEPAIEGSGADVIQHVLVKPLEVGISTTMLITTDRRSYHLMLKARNSKDYLPRVSFAYPGAALAQFKRLTAQNAAMKKRDAIQTTADPASKAYLGDLNFNYTIDGDVSWKPVRVFDNGEKTIIEMPKEMLYREAPTLMILDHEGGWFSDDKVSVMNYRLQGTRYIVDGLFDQAILSSGVGSSQQRVVIRRDK